MPTRENFRRTDSWSVLMQDEDFKNKVLVALTEISAASQQTIDRQNRIETSFEKLLESVQKQVEHINQLVLTTTRFEEKISSLEEKTSTRLSDVEEVVGDQHKKQESLKDHFHELDKRFVYLERIAISDIPQIKESLHQLQISQTQDSMRWLFTNSVVNPVLKWLIPVAGGGIVLYIISKMSGVV